MKLKVFAVAAHADDIEFGMAGTLILLAQAGCEIHYQNLANGSCGSAVHDAATISAIRLQEARNAAALIGAKFYPPLVPDIEIFYEKELLARVSSIMRQVAPDILLVPSPDDYMEDHTNACRLAVAAAFCRGMPNFPVKPLRAPANNEVTVYHAQPHGHRDQLNRWVQPDFLVKIDSVIETKTKMLAEHTSQKDWLDRSQGFNAYLEIMKKLSAEMGALTENCPYAEGWRRHNPLGFCASEADPLEEILSEFIIKLP